MITERQLDKRKRLWEGLLPRWTPNYQRDGMNHMDGARDFMRRWDAPGDPAHEKVEDIRASAYGNLNTTGQAGDYRSPALTRHQRQFAGAVEPGVRELVLLLVERFDWITYSSCEGHIYTDHSLYPVERHVGLLPRDEAERQRIRATLQRAVDAVGRGSLVRPFVYELVLTSDDGHFPVVDLMFRRPRLLPWPSYFKRLERPYRDTLAALSRSP